MNENYFLVLINLNNFKIFTRKFFFNNPNFSISKSPDFQLSNLILKIPNFFGGKFFTVYRSTDF